MKTCGYCKGDYDEADTKTANLHTEVSTRRCNCTRCEGKPSCYTCTSSFCFCTNGH
ncbi:hypothetical protein ACFT25_15870 [Streptomyces hydrogenans]|uniref:hypothetical protein n=1 Tax=Streptomyces hydrogenans TaxID=1873719 RepID=UPI00363F51B2